jgi:phosphatidylserine synthase
MPSNVRNFFWLNCMSMVLGAVTSVLMAPKLTEIAAAAGHGPGFVMGIQIFVTIMVLIFLWLIAFKRQNWARWVWLAMSILGAPGSIANFKTYLGTPLAAAIHSTQMVLMLVALYFVFTGNAKPWFRRDAPVEIDAF